MKIVTDSAADLPLDEIEALEINIAPLLIQFPEEEVQSDDITPDTFYDRLKAMRPNIPTTAMPSMDMFARIYKQVAEKGEEILSIHISSGLSGTFDVASQGAKQSGENVTMVDTMTLSGGQRFQVLAAALAAKAGQSKEEILKLLERIRAATEVIYTLETLEYLQRGGRIGRVQALASSVLNIKPIINVDKADGKYSTVGKTRTLKKALKTIQEHLDSIYGDEPLWVCVLHGKFAEQAEELAAMVQERLNVAKLEVLRISPVLGVHTGPGIVGIAALPLALMADLL
ncbi:MAG: DegV family protein [Anaerolineales bacterium]|nr:DegV family protein [Anaerolineales bacterium]